MSTAPNFDQIIDRRGSGCAKWDAMEKFSGVAAEDGMAMWVADMDFRSPQVVLDRGREMVEHGFFGYTTGDGGLFDAAAWWMKARHGWAADPAHMFTTIRAIEKNAPDTVHVSVASVWISSPCSRCCRNR